MFDPRSAQLAKGPVSIGSRVVTGDSSCRSTGQYEELSHLKSSTRCTDIVASKGGFIKNHIWKVEDEPRRVLRNVLWSGGSSKYSSDSRKERQCKAFGTVFAASWLKKVLCFFSILPCSSAD
eukprot:SM000050S16957  [mRNA]  locus=s50:29819:32038:+ [translate_table: standard]